MSTADPPSPDTGDLRGLAHSIRQLFEIAATTLGEDAQPSELARRVAGYLGCELTAIVPVTERFPKWEHVNVQRGVDAYLAVSTLPGVSCTSPSDTTPPVITPSRNGGSGKPSVRSECGC